MHYLGRYKKTKIWRCDEMILILKFYSNYFANNETVLYIPFNYLVPFLILWLMLKVLFRNSMNGYFPGFLQLFCVEIKFFWFALIRLWTAELLRVQEYGSKRKVLIFRERDSIKRDSIKSLNFSSILSYFTTFLLVERLFVYL